MCFRIVLFKRSTLRRARLKERFFFLIWLKNNIRTILLVKSMFIERFPEPSSTEKGFCKQSTQRTDFLSVPQLNYLFLEPQYVKYWFLEEFFLRKIFLEPSCSMKRFLEPSLAWWSVFIIIPLEVWVFQYVATP